ncbi:MAG: oligosaccharide flippase family protein [Candidatus Marinimicrobia bacterium]|nr:oligosaccharide flippase family protein [Candidatus Neomarinimicrobiota bacterium]
MSKKSFFIDISTTFIAQIIAAILGIVVLKIISFYLSEETFGAYLISRRTAGIGFTLVSLNLGMSMARYININKAKSEFYLLSSILFSSCICLILTVIMHVFKPAVAQALFGSVEYIQLINPTILMIYAYTFQAICSGYHRGLSNFSKMNLINISFNSFALLSIIVFLNNSQETQDILQKYLYSFATLSIVFNWYLLFNNKQTKMKLISSVKSKRKIKELINEQDFFKYGVSRLPSSFFFSLIFFIPIIAASNNLSLVAAAYIGIIISIVRIIQITGIPFNLLLLPKFSLYQSSEQKETISRYCQLIIDFIISVMPLIGLLLYLFSSEIIILWFGNKYTAVNGYLNIVSPFLGPFIGYFIIRGILDGLSEFPYSNIINAIGVIIVTLFTGLSIIFSWGISGIIVSFCLGIFAIGIAAMIVLIRLQHLRIFNRNNVLALIIISVLFILVSFLKSQLIIESILISIILKSIFTLVVGTVLLLTYHKMGYTWLDELPLSIIGNRK